MASNYLIEEDLKSLVTHKYANGGLSALDRYMDVFWKKLQTFIPKVILLNITYHHFIF